MTHWFAAMATFATTFVQQASKVPPPSCGF
jgi:hypothetical protein